LFNLWIFSCFFIILFAKVKTSCLLNKSDCMIKNTTCLIKHNDWFIKRMIVASNSNWLIQTSNCCF
jgi:hypothetical protein